jgi:hypothetical protein
MTRSSPAKRTHPAPDVPVELSRLLPANYHGINRYNHPQDDILVELRNLPRVASKPSDERYQSA